MKKIILLSFLGTATLGFSQNNPIDFEPDGFGADWNWSTFEAPDGFDDPEFSVVPNISVDEVNGSANVARMVIDYPSSEPWGQAGCESEHGTDLGSFVVTEANSTVSMMIYQEGFAAPVALKFATPVGAAFFETIVQNDVADAWVEVEFDMSGWIGSTLPGDPDQIIFFPSYGPRATGHTVYFDNVVFGPQGPAPGEPMTAAPDPTIDEDLVISVYSDFYTANTVDNFNFNAFQGGGVVSEVVIEGNNTGKIEGLTFYGAEWDAVDLTEYQFVHLDYWTSTSTGFNFYLIDQTAGIPGGAPEEPRYAFGPGGDEPVVMNEWVSVTIPLQHFLDFPSTGFDYDVTDIFQWKFDGNGTLFFDNVYFSQEETASTAGFDANGITAFPNPSKNVWNLRSEHAPMTRVTVFNAVGQVVWSAVPHNETVVLDASAMKPGLYIARIETAEGATALKLIKD